jgi:hypothetical protein
MVFLWVFMGYPWFFAGFEMNMYLNNLITPIILNGYIKRETPLLMFGVREGGCCLESLRMEQEPPCSCLQWERGVVVPVVAENGMRNPHLCLQLEGGGDFSLSPFSLHSICTP